MQVFLPKSSLSPSLPFRPPPHPSLNHQIPLSSVPTRQHSLDERLGFKNSRTLWHQNRIALALTPCLISYQKVQFGRVVVGNPYPCMFLQIGTLRANHKAANYRLSEPQADENDSDQVNTGKLLSFTWGSENSNPVTSCFTTAEFPGMFLANTGTSKSIAWKDVKGKGDRWAITVRVCVVRWANLWQNDSLVSLELWHHTKITPKLCPSGFPTQTPDFPTTHWILMTDYICKCWQTIYCNGLSYCNVTKKPSLSPMFSSPFVSGSLEYTFWKYLPIYLAA